MRLQLFLRSCHTLERAVLLNTFFLRKACFESDFGAFVFAQGKIKTRQLGKRNEVRAFRFKFTHSTLATK